MSKISAHHGLFLSPPSALPCTCPWPGQAISGCYLISARCAQGSGLLLVHGVHRALVFADGCGALACSRLWGVLPTCAHVWEWGTHSQGLWLHQPCNNHQGFAARCSSSLGKPVPGQRWASRF